MKRDICALAAAVLVVLGAGPGAAKEYALAGRWVTTSGESAYAVSYCGDDGTALCGKLVWLRKDAMKGRAKAYLGEYLVRDAPKIGPNKWTAHVDVFGYSIGGEILLTSDKDMTLHGCWLFIICKTFHLHKVAP